MTKVNFQALRAISLYRLCLQAARRSATRAKAEEMRLLCRLKFRDGSSADYDRAQALLTEGVRELASFMYYLGIAESRKIAGAGGRNKLPFASPEVAEAAVHRSVEEAAAAAADRLAKLGQARRVLASMVTGNSSVATAIQSHGGGVPSNTMPAAGADGSGAALLGSVGSARQASATAALAAECMKARPVLSAQPESCTCGACGSALAAQAKFCGECGAAALCTGCGTRYSPSAKFCSECGLKRPSPLA